MLVFYALSFRSPRGVTVLVRKVTQRTLIFLPVLYCKFIPTVDIKGKIMLYLTGKLL